MEKTMITKPSDRELMVTREFDAPRELLFEVWTDPKHLEQWYGPNGFRTETLSMDVRPGGVWRQIMHGPDGREYKNRVVYSEVAPPERLVYRHAGETDEEPVHHETTTTFDDLGEGRTRVSMRLVFPTAAELEFVVKTYGAEQGGVQTMERLAEHVAAMPTARREVTLTRRFDASREDVWRAWTDAEVLRLWWGPKGFTAPVCEVDARPGGRMRIVMRGPDGAEYPMRCVFREVVKPELLVFTNVPLNADGGALMAGLTTVTFEEMGGQTEMSLHTVMTTMTERAVPMIEGMNQGWSMSMQKLAELMASMATHPTSRA